MNFLGHLEVARRVHGDDPVVLLGAMLPDLGSPARLKVGPLDAWPPATAAGIECHRRADDAFHADPRFLAGMVALRDELVTTGLARGPARGAAHIGWELLLDGVLLERDDVRSAYASALDAPEAAWVGEGAAPGASTWRDVVRRYRERGLPAQAMDADAVADRVVALLARRPRLAVDPADAPAVAAAFAAIRRSVEAEADAVLMATTTSTSTRARDGVGFS